MNTSALAGSTAKINARDRQICRFHVPHPQAAFQKAFAEINPENDQISVPKVTKGQRFTYDIWATLFRENLEILRVVKGKLMRLYITIDCCPNSRLEPCIVRTSNFLYDEF